MGIDPTKLSKGFGNIMTKIQKSKKSMFSLYLWAKSFSETTPSDPKCSVGPKHKIWDNELDTILAMISKSVRRNEKIQIMYF